MENFPYLILIPLIPLLSSMIIRFSPVPLKEKFVSFLAPFAIFLSFLISCSAFFTLKNTEGILVQNLYTWIDLPNLKIDFSLMFDNLTAVMTLTISFIAFLIHVYSTAYMKDDESYNKYFAYLNLFTFFMLLLITSKNLVLMFIGWEGVGLCSYLLIGFWFKDIKNAKAGKKAFIINRIGDFGFICGIIILGIQMMRVPGIEMFTLDFEIMKGAVAFLGNPENSIKVLGISVVGLSALALFFGATGKSAQIPLYVWLPDAMAGPTPVSALIHAATMVTAGVYMVCRLNYIFLLTPNLLTLIAWTGCLTALIAAGIATVQNDIKKVLAYSTISQLGYMFMGLGVGAFSAGIFHLVTHAFFKGLLFLGAGSVIYAMHHEQDMRKMGGLRKRLPITFLVITAGWYAISALPFGSGFFSKEMIIHSTYTSANGGIFLFSLALFTGGLTAYYMSRMYFMTFFGDSNCETNEINIKESPVSMLYPMMILGLFSLFGGFIPVTDFLSEYNKIIETRHFSGLLLAGISILFSGIGIALAWYHTSVQQHQKKSERNIIEDFFFNGYFINEIYTSVFVNNAIRAGKFLQKFSDKLMIDGFLHGCAGITVYASGLVTAMQNGKTSSYLFSILTGVLLILYFLIF